MKVRFVDSALRSLKPHRVKYDVHDPEGDSLVLRISSDGRKTWMACYSSYPRPKRLTHKNASPTRGWCDSIFCDGYIAEDRRCQRR